MRMASYIIPPRGNFSRILNEIKIQSNKKYTIINARPRKIGIYTSSRCNLSCHMCGYQSKESTGEYKSVRYPDMSFERFKHIMSFFPEACALTLTAEGEPFLNKDIFQMINYAKKDLKLFVDMTSNGICLNNEMADQIISSKLDILNISLDGTCFEEYNSIRGGTEDQFKTLVANVKNLCSKVKSLNSSLEINVTFITTIVNYKQLPKMIDFVISLGVEGVQFQNVLDFETKFMSEHRPIYKSNKEAVSFINSIKKPDKIKRIIWPLVLDLDIIKSEHHINCHYPFTTIGVNTNGDVNLCCLVNTQESYGNIFKDYDVWNNKPFQDIRQTLSKGKMPFKLCKTCPLSME